MNEYLSRYKPEVFYSPLLDLFYESCQELGILGYWFDTPRALDPLAPTYVKKIQQTP